MIAAGLAAAALLVTGVAVAAISSTYTVSGIEVAATSTEGTFVGSGTGSDGDSLLWRAVVVHEPLSTTTPASITPGGSLAALSYGDGLRTLTGTFTGGTVTYDTALSSPAPCGNQVYDVEGSLNLASGASIGTGAFEVYLTHYRIRLFGRCITVGATVSGAPGLSVSLP
jgi:hypothetical protein